MDIMVRYLTVGLKKENSYIIEYGDHGWLIDPGDEFDKLDMFFNLNHCNFQGILNTHGHFDHIGAVQDFRVKYNIPFYAHSKDKRTIHQANLIKRFTGDTRLIKTPVIDFLLDDILQVPIGDKTINVHYTPGHSAGSVCFELDNNLFTGDIIFPKEIGLYNMPGGDKNKIKNSVRFLLANFSGYQIFPGHGQPFILDENITKQLSKLI